PKLTPELQARVPARVLRTFVPGETLAEVLPRLQETYCGTIAYELEHISDHEQRVWLRQVIESGRYRTPFSPEEKRALLGRLTEVEGLERYLQRAFLGQKQFSIEGLPAACRRPARRPSPPPEPGRTGPRTRRPTRGRRKL